MELRLEKGGRLFCLRHEDEDDVSERAHEFLFKTVTMADDVTLGDVFLLMESSPMLQAIQRQNFAKELCEAARKGVSPQFKPGYSEDGIEYLEVYAVWGFDSTTKTYGGRCGRWDFHGIGYELKEDRCQDDWVMYPKGSRVNWGISTADVRELLPLPIRVNTTVAVTEADFDKEWGHTLHEVVHPCITLGELIEAIMWELSFHGSPSDTEEFREMLQDRVDEVRSGEAELIPLDDVLAELRGPVH